MEKPIKENSDECDGLDIWGEQPDYPEEGGRSVGKPKPTPSKLLVSLLKRTDLATEDTEVSASKQALDY